eukprot:m.7486 g.7486  ORF g.7486 m.7486 type:complete len:92 (+) comp18785_c0_seq1:503-778(+)
MSEQQAASQAASQSTIDELMQRLEVNEADLRRTNDELTEELSFSQVKMSEFKEAYGRVAEGFDYSYRYGQDENSIRKLSHFISQSLNWTAC